MKKKIISYLLIAVLTGITLYIVFSSKDIADFPTFIKSIDAGFLMIAVSCMLLYMLMNVFIIYEISREVTDRVSLLASLYLNFIGLYYSAITPFSGGGQPVQIMTLKMRYNIGFSKGTSITMKKFIIYQVVISIFALLMFVLRYPFIRDQYDAYMIFIIIGVVGNLLLGLLIIMMAYTDVLVKRIAAILLKICHKLHLFRKRTEEEINHHIDEYVENIKDIQKNKMVMLRIILYTAIQTVSYFSITYFIYLAMNLHGYHYLDLLAIQALVYVAVSFIPTPGNAGASEGGFYILLKPFFPQHFLLYAMTIWRIITYYGVLILSGLALVFVRVKDMIKERKTIQKVNQ